MKYLIWLTILCLFAQGILIDPNTFSNYQEVKINHLHIEWLLNLDNKYINATSIYDFTVASVNGISNVNFNIKGILC